MPSASYPTKTAWFHGFIARALPVAVALSALSTACGGDDGPDRAGAGGGRRDAGQDGGGVEHVLDGEVPMLADPRDSGPRTGEPPPELEGAACAIDTNKLYDLVTLEAGPRPTQLAVDLMQSEFGLAYVGPSASCMDAVFMTLLSGGSGVGQPEDVLVSDACTTVEHVSVVHTGTQWVLAIADGRNGPTDVSTVVVDDAGAHVAERVTESDARELETVLAVASADRLMVSWVDVDLVTTAYRLGVRLLDLAGKPVGEEVVLEDSDEWRYSGLALQRIGDSFVGLGYKRVSLDGTAEIVLDVLDVTTGERDRDPWVLSDSAGSGGGIDLATDVSGGAVLYSVGEGTSLQLWLQLLGPDGGPAAAMSGLLTGGPLPPDRIIGPPIDATDASLAKLPRGYAVAYRVLPRDDDPTDDAGAPQPRVRVYFLDRFGHNIGDSDVALALPYGGRTAIESAYDGRIVVGWSDTDDDGQTTVTAVKLPCVGGS